MKSDWSEVLLLRMSAECICVLPRVHGMAPIFRLVCKYPRRLVVGLAGTTRGRAREELLADQSAREGSFFHRRRIQGKATEPAGTVCVDDARTNFVLAAVFFHTR